MIKSLVIPVINGFLFATKVAIIVGLEEGTARLARTFADIQKTHLMKALSSCGLHKAQPASHADLMERIADTGAVITPYAYGREALRFRFIGRNDLLASWCNTLLVVEAGMKSGSMYTARSALHL